VQRGEKGAEMRFSVEHRKLRARSPRIVPPAQAIKVFWFLQGGLRHSSEKNFLFSYF
jgi:hypothetical protein